jgi:hypothetical protein
MPSSWISTEVPESRIVHLDALLWRSTFVTPSRTVQPNSSRLAAGTSSSAPGTSASMFAEANAARALTSSGASVTSRRPAIVARTSVSASRASRSMSAISAVARASSWPTSRLASSAFTVITVSE